MYLGSAGNWGSPGSGKVMANTGSAFRAISLAARGYCLWGWNRLLSNAPGMDKGESFGDLDLFGPGPFPESHGSLVPHSAVILG